MLFNSFEYAIFLTVVFFTFWFLLPKRPNFQNAFLIMASYVFYAWWDWRFLFLLLFISSANYLAGIQMGKTDDMQKRRFLLWIGLAVDVGILGVFKYFNFFSESAVDLLNTFGFKADYVTVNLILPIGISFYTFQTISYIIDVYRETLEPSKNILSFFAYVSFFPLVLAGPIERGGNLLPQLNSPRKFNYDQSADGMRQILWGLFKKVVIADNCAVLANEIFKNYGNLPGSVLIMGSIYFALQIYGDFSGYSDIAIGSAKLLGFNLTTNFQTPYFSRDFAEFWRRWHISLSTWLRDYLFIPMNLQLRNHRKWAVVISAFVTFTICGLWHGANWTFIFWGALNGIYLIPVILSGWGGKYTDTVAEGKLLPSFKETAQMGFTFALTCLGWVFFKSESIGQAFSYIGKIFSNNFLKWNADYFPKHLLFVLAIFIACEWLLFRYDDFFERFRKMNKFYRRLSYAFVLLLLFLFIQNAASTFIYFQF